MTEPLTTVTSSAAVFDLDGIETDQIIPARHCVRPTGADYADALFAGWRYNDDGSERQDFVLNQPAFRRARILVTGERFGYGSSREHAAWALRDFGVRVIIAVSFASIFRANAIRSGILPVALARSEVQRLMRELCSGPGQLTVDLRDQVVRTPAGEVLRFEVEGLTRELLLAGQDAIAYVLEFMPEVDRFVQDDQGRRPWVYETVAQ